jgi:hypothetical protein
MNGVVEMLIGYTNEMSDHELAELADWADYHAKDVPNPTWKRAYALIREGADLLLRRRALSRQEETPEGEKRAPKVCAFPTEQPVNRQS